MSNEELKKIPGIGNSIAKRLNAIGIMNKNDLRGKDPEELYVKICNFQNKKINICLLYDLRMICYYVNSPVVEEEKLKWWKWKDNHKSTPGITGFSNI